MENLAIAPAITAVINVIKPFISDKRLLPVIALLLWLVVGILTNKDLITWLLEWVGIWLASTGVHELTKIGKSTTEISSTVESDLSDKYREDV